MISESRCIELIKEGMATLKQEMKTELAADGVLLETSLNHINKEAGQNVEEVKDQLRILKEAIVSAMKTSEDIKAGARVLESNQATSVKDNMDNFEKMNKNMFEELRQMDLDITGKMVQLQVDINTTEANSMQRMKELQTTMQGEVGNYMQDIRTKMEILQWGMSRSRRVPL